jgi:hypothetical protein
MDEEDEGDGHGGLRELTILSGPYIDDPGRRLDAGLYLKIHSPETLRPGRVISGVLVIFLVIFVDYFSGLFFEDQRHLDQVLADEPGLEFVGAEDVADDEVVGALVAGFVGCFGDVEAALDDQLVGFEETGDLDGHLFPAAGRAPDPGSFGYVCSHGDGDTAKELNALGDGVDHFDLFVEVLVEEEVELVEGWAGDLPVVFFVHVTQ